MPSGRQVKRRIGPAWTRRGRPTAGFFTKRTAEEWLRSTLASLDDLAARGAQVDVTFAEGAAEWLRYAEFDRADPLCVLGQVGEDDGLTLLINAHIDVVPAGDAAGWTTPPSRSTRALRPR